MKTALEKVTEKRIRQFNVHHRTIEKDIELNSDGQLRAVSSFLISPNPKQFPLDHLYELGNFKNWDKDYLISLSEKSYEERLILAATFLIAEIDRINAI